MKSFLLALFATLFATTAMAIEEPSYTVVQQLDGLEIRHYAPYVAAQVVIQDTAEQAGNAGFRILAAYIFGQNRAKQAIAMTAPVTQTAASTQLPMTAPVIQTAASGGYVVQFVLPRTLTLATAPEPLDARIQVLEVPSRRLAVIRYSGRWTQANYAEHLTELQAKLQAAQLKWSGEPTLARYNPPITPWFLRRNEIWLTLDDASRSGE